MKKTYVIKNEERNDYLAAINIGYSNKILPMYFRGIIKYAIHFEDIKEAQATINFISEVIDWEEAQELQIVDIEELELEEI